MSKSIIAALAQRFRERAEALNYKGVKRDNAALDFFCGAATACEIIGAAKEAKQYGMVAALMISTRGYSAILELAREGDAFDRQSDAPPAYSDVGSG